jgi:hypothetical protein
MTDPGPESYDSASSQQLGRFRQGQYLPRRDALVGSVTGMTALASYYLFTEIRKNQDLKDAVSKFRTAISDFQLRLESFTDISPDKKSLIIRYINSLRSSVTYQFANLTYSERTSELGSVRKILDAIGNQNLTVILDSLYKKMVADFNSVKSASDAASRIKIGREALMVGAGAGLATGLASAALGKIFFSEGEPGEAGPPCAGAYDC